MPFDIVIPLGPKDEDIIQRCVASAREFIVGVRTIFVVSHRPLVVPGAIVLEESIVPFSKAEVATHVLEGTIGWYLQQLIKLYAPSVIPDCLEDCLILDADTIFFKRVRFMEGGKYLFDKNHETHPPYFVHMLRLHPSFQPAYKQRTSGIVNVMLMNKNILQEIFKLVEDYHKKPFWIVFLEQLPRPVSGASEYEIYFHYIFRVYPQKVLLRPLQYDNFGQRSDITGAGFHYKSFHHHVQKRKIL